MVHAIDSFLTHVGKSDDFTQEEIARVHKVREICLQDISLLEEAHHKLAESKRRLARKKESLNAFMEKLTADDLQTPLIETMLEGFMQTHIQLANRIQNVEETLNEMYPQWTQSPSVSSPLAVIAPDHVSIQLDAILDAMEGAEQRDEREGVVDV